MNSAVVGHLSRWLALFGGILFLVATCLPALDLGERGLYPGWPLLLFGWVGVFRVLDGDLNYIGWLANPLFALGTIAMLIGMIKPACWLLTAAAMFAQASFWLKEVLLDEGGSTAAVQGYEVGFWLWMAAIAVNLLLAILILLFSCASSNKKASRLSSVGVEP